jgi:hypothetical protein
MAHQDLAQIFYTNSTIPVGGGVFLVNPNPGEAAKLPINRFEQKMGKNHFWKLESCSTKGVRELALFMVCISP